MIIQPLTPSYEVLKRRIKDYEVHEQLELDDKLNSLRKDKFYDMHAHNVDKYNGKIFQSKNSGDFMIVEYFDYDKIAIVFLNTGYRMLSNIRDISTGEVQDPYVPKVLGVGFVGIGPYKVDGSPYERMIYSKWRNILNECYINHIRNEFVNPEWFNFQNFAAWFNSEFYCPYKSSMYDMVVDKDVLYPGNEEFGPYKCVLLPGFIDCKVHLQDSEKEQIFNWAHGCMQPDEVQRLFKYKEIKEHGIRCMADEYHDILPPHVYLAIKNYKMF